MRDLLVIVWTVLAIGLVSPAAATTYYVSPGGSNAWAGTSPSSAWQTIERVNAHDFEPGDRILFEGGHTFSGNLYFDGADSGTATAPVTVSSYGIGRATIYSAAGHGILGYNAAGFRIAELYIVGSGRDVNNGSGILFFTDLPGDVLLDFIEVDHVDAVRFGDYGVEIGANAGRSGFRNVRITHVVASENGLGGIFTYAFARAVHRNVYVGYSSAFLNAGFAGLPNNSGNGITLSGVDGGTIERSVARDNGWRSDAGNGPVGIWTFDSNRVVIQFNEAYNNKTGGSKDGGGFHLDNSTSNSVMQYNYSHDNAGAGFMLAHKWNDYVHTGNVVRWNISENDARRNNHASIHLWGRIRNAQIYNNTVFLAAGNPAARAMHARNSSIETQDLENVHIRNNIFQTTGGLPLVDFTSAVLDTATGVRLEGNAYWSTGGAFRIIWRGTTYGTLGAFRTASGQERIGAAGVGVVADPELEAPGNGPNFNNATMIGGLWQYRLKSTSLLIDAGVDLQALGIDVGARDFFGGAARRHSAADIGAHEFEAPCNWTLTPASATLRAAGGTGSIAVWAAATSCGWAALPSAAWLFAMPEAGSGERTVTFSARPNASTTARSATIRIANRLFTVYQAGNEAAPPPPPPSPPPDETGAWNHGDVGSTGVSGTATGNGIAFTVEGAGADIWGSADGFHFVHQQVSGDWEIETEVAGVENVDVWTKAGLMIRETLNANARHASIFVTPGKGLSFQYRANTGSTTAAISAGTGVAPQWIRLRRRASTFTAYRRGADGTWSQVATTSIAMASTVYIGLAVSSHDATQLATARFESVALRGAAAPPPPPPSTSPGEDIVLWAAEAPVRSGWVVTPDTTAAGGARLQNPNKAAARVATPLAQPTLYFEVTFHALAGRPYRIWMRGKGTSNTWDNDSVWVQFDNANAWKIGTTDAALVNIEDCSGCGLSGWGWQDNGYGVGVMGPTVTFATTGTQRLRVQVREDGLAIDQIVVSSVRWLNRSPGALKNDTTILPKQ